jgi:tetratricopeptide (TPR) repeat protein
MLGSARRADRSTVEAECSNHVDWFALPYSERRAGTVRPTIGILFLTLASVVFAQVDSTVPEPEEIQLPQKNVGLEINDKTFFADRVGTAYVHFDTVVDMPEYWSRESDTCSVIDIEVVNTPDSKKGKSAATLRFLPKQSGVVTLPVLDFKSATFEYLTEPLQVLVSEPIRSPALSLKIEPSEQTVYAGQPVRFDLTWACTLNAGALKALRLDPAFFQDPNIEVIIPRNTDAEDDQVGLPVGGRRVVAKRSKFPNNDKALGVVTLPIFVRFDEPGNYTLPETRLECVKLAKADSDFGRYAAHFNNSLFEAVDSTVKYERIYTLAAPFEIEVLPLPPEPSATFSGLFEPLQVDVSVRPPELEIGQLMELEIKLSGEAPHGMLELPLLSQQPALRERFLVDDNYGRLWHEAGTTFRSRFRVLSTSVQAFPSLQFSVFDPETGSYDTHRTEAIPLKVKASDGQQFISLKSFEGAAVSLTNQPEGIWHNMESNPMNDLLNTLFSFIRSAFWPLLLLGPVAFILLLPVVRDRRRRALDVRYRLRAEAYSEFKKHASNSKEKWNAFLRFMAITFDAGDKAWTRSDSESALQQIGANDSELNALMEMHNAADAEDFSQEGPQAQFKNLDGLAKLITQLTTNSLLLLLFVVILLPQSARADEWSEAEQLFAQARSAPAGGEAANTLYQDAALKFQVAARSNQRPGEAWYNAGNAWFKAGAVGRAIVAYRQAELYRPFDPIVADNLAAVRAMTLNDVPDAKPWWQQLPTTWLKVALVVFNLFFWGLLLLALRYRERGWIFAIVVIGIALLVVSAFTLNKTLTAQLHGAVVVDAVYGKKGPGYAYANAFNEPLHDGLEFILIEQREGWGLVELPDGRQCWLPIGQVQLIAE